MPDHIHLVGPTFKRHDLENVEHCDRQMVVTYHPVAWVHPQPANMIHRAVRLTRVLEELADLIVSTLLRPDLSLVDIFFEHRIPPLASRFVHYNFREVFLFGAHLYTAAPQ